MPAEKQEQTDVRQEAARPGWLGNERDLRITRPQVSTPHPGHQALACGFLQAQEMWTAQREPS